MERFSQMDFDILYNQQILPGLRDAEKIRKKILLNYSIIGTVAFAGFIVEAMTWMLLAITAIILFIILYTRWYNIPVSRFEKAYIDAIRVNTVNYISSALQIDSNSHLALSELQQAMVISGTPQHFGGNYLISGEPEGILVRISEINSSSNVMKESGNIWQQDHFNGLVGIGQMENKITQNIMICSGRQIEDHLATFGDMIKIEFHDGNELLVYSRNEEDYKKYISAELITEIQEFILQTNNQIMFTVYPGGVCLAIIKPRGFQYLEPSVFKSSYTKKPAEQYYRDLAFVTRTILLAADRVAVVQT